MNSKIIANGILRALGIIVGITLILLFLYKIQTVIIYLVIAGVLSLIGRPIMILLKQKLKFNETLAVIITMLFFLVIVTGIVSMFIPLVIEQGENLSLLDVDALQTSIEDIYIQFIEHFGLNEQDVETSINDSKLMSKLNFGFIPDFLNTFITGLGSFSIGLFSVLFILFFFLKDSKLFSSSLLTLFPKSENTRLKTTLSKIRELLSRYFGGLVLQILILFTIYSITLFIFGIENAIVIATLCALLNIIPYVGPLISAFLILLLSVSSNLGEDFSSVILPKATYVMIGFIIAQLVDNFFSQPFIFSKSVKSHPLEIFLVIIVFGLLFGITGLIIAIPLYTTLKVIAKEFFSEYRIVKKLTRDL
ncbi:AI-2E family transporter [Winogradskyella echinorum]|uniref:AI-2E family transporter n=1 Tax=Winogradskyella echinorum TaxID=538189 RepID=A0ABR6Y1A2_9FLAO|nr:AI-2E family transporter [Winogradskyella echinorum]MBC3846534.1 AI-2E family transporter [Winogradskyella echinorum]MBC5750882.1 AI-2E family transporter [Winogradskyella echinorum]